MLIGNTEDFAIECYHDPLVNQHGWVFGRMCIWVQGRPLGDIDEPACVLNVTGAHLEDVLRRIDSLDDPALGSLSDPEAFAFLDNVLYLDENRSLEEVRQDARRFFKFDFLTNGGESFDGTKSFLIGDADYVRLLFRNEKDEFASARIPLSSFVVVVRAFLVWVSGERIGMAPWADKGSAR